MPERGLRQGDPFSPYLFLFCMDALSKLLHHAQVEGTKRGIRASQNGPRIDHLFFADDALLFVRNMDNEASVTMNILRDSKDVPAKKSISPNRLFILANTQRN